MQEIKPYRFGTGWVFDDPKVALRREALVAGIDHMLTKVVGKRSRCRVQFSDRPFPGYQYRLDWLRQAAVEIIWVGNVMGSGRTGNWYRCPQLKMEGWLCPALFHYFHRAPRHIYVRVTV